jgi:hypothetical protein
MAKLTTRTLASGASLNDLIHIVITGDTSQDPDGSSYKASLSQLVPLFGGSPDVYLTGGTAVSSDGTLTFTNSTGGTFTVSGLTTPFTGGSGNCITSFYTNNIHACLDEITVHNRVQSTGSDAQGILSFAFGSTVEARGDYSHAEGISTVAYDSASHAEGVGTQASGLTSHAEGQYTQAIGDASHSEGQSTQAVGFGSHAEGSGTTATGDYSHSEGDSTQAIGDYSHAEGWNTLAIGDYSHAEGYRTYAGTNKGYLATGLTAGIIYLSSSYGDITTEYIVDSYIYINDESYANTLNETYRKVSGATFNGSQTIIYLYDILTSTSSSAVVGDTGGVWGWVGDQNVGGFASNTKGSGTGALGALSLSVNNSNSTFSDSSFAQGKGNIVFGNNSCVFNDTNYVVGTNSASFGTGNDIDGEVSFSLGANNIIRANESFAGGRNNLVNGFQGFVFSFGSEMNSEYGAILAGTQNLIQSGTTQNSTILGGEYNTITGLAPSDPVDDSSIIGGSGNTVQSFSSVIVGGEGNTISSGSRTVVLGGTGITATLSNTVYVPNIVLAYSGTPSGSTSSDGVAGSLLWDDTYFYYKDNTGWKRISGATW